MDITFNTGRLYTKDGQIIRVVWDKDAGKIHFNDHSRMITGTIDAPDKSFTDAWMLASHVMGRYDQYDYRWSGEAAQLRRDPDASIHAFRL